MKVILRQDVVNLGDRGQIVNVARGYARNFLLPKGLAWDATPGNIRNIELQKHVWHAREIKLVDEARAIADRLGKLDLVIAKKAGTSETLYGSVTNVEIADLLAKNGFDIDRRRIVLAEPIKALGEYAVPIKLHSQVTAEVKLKVAAEEA